MAYDPCYHQACDTFANNNNSVLDLNSDSIANAVIKYSKSTETVNGVRGNGHNLATAEARQAVALAEAAAAS